MDLLKKISYNLPNLSTCAEWSPNGITFKDSSTKEFTPVFLFLDKNNTLFATSPTNKHIYIWLNDKNNSNIKIPDRLYTPYGLFVSTIGDMYTSDDALGRVDRWIEQTKTIELAVRFCGRCESIFISIHDVIYCAIGIYHLIVTKPLRNYSDLMTIVAGVGLPGFAENMLKFPQGIFVNINSDLYVADTGNHRVQLFRFGEINAITIAGSFNTIQLNRPTSIALDANNYVYIVDHWNHRIVASTPYGFRCIVGCNGSGDLFDKLNSPNSMAFDSFGNIYVTDLWNYRIQKFLLLNKTCHSNDYTNMNTSFLTSTSDLNTSIVYESEYKSIITRDSLTFRMYNYCNGPQHFYKNLQIHVFQQGKYDIFINSTEHLYVSLYKDYFYPLDIDLNSLFRLDERCEINQIKFTRNFHSNETYDLIISTVYSNLTFSFSLILTGPSHINLNQTNVSSIVQSIYMSALTLNSSKCNQNKFGLFNYYCEVIEIHVIKTGTYVTLISSKTMDMYGYMYKNNFTLLDLSINMILTGINYIRDCNNQLIISFDSQINTSIILVVTTSQQQQQGNFSITVNGPNKVIMKHKHNISSIIQSHYSSELNNNSQKHDDLHSEQFDYYYEAVKINVNITDFYLLLSYINFEAYSYLYEHNFDPYDSNRNLLSSDAIDDHSKVSRYRITRYLQSNITYVLVITTKHGHKNVQGEFAAIVYGSNEIHMKKIDNISTIVQSIHELTLIKHDSHCYKAIQIVVPQSDFYNIAIINNTDEKVFLYTKNFKLNRPIERLVSNNYSRFNIYDFVINARLVSNITYILVLASTLLKPQDKLTILVSGPRRVSIYQINPQVTYSSQLTIKNEIYSRICGTGNYHYETIELSVQLSGTYIFNSDSSILLYGYLYENNFNPLYPMENLIAENYFSFYDSFQFGNYLEVKRKYILLLTTFEPNVKGSFTIGISGPKNVTFKKTIKNRSSCVTGNLCDPYQKTIGLTINDILRNQVQPSISFQNQSSLIQVAATITMIMFSIGFINGICSLITFQNKELRNVGCGIYLLASSITSLLTIALFTIKFWLAVLTQLYSTVNSAALRVDCAFIGPFLKLCLYLDGWLNACVAIERTVNVSKGVSFDKKMSTRIARGMIFILLIFIFGTLVHEPIKHDLFKYTIPNYKSINDTLTEEHHAMCIIQYSRSLQNYNTFTLVFHFILPFVANLCSVLFIIFGTTRQRSRARKNQTFKDQIVKQIKKHKQLLISPFILLLLVMPRLILLLGPGCVNPSNNPWLYLCGYFISYTPPMLIFAVFVIPSSVYMSTFKQSMARWLRRIRQ